MALHTKEFKKIVFEQIMFAASFEYKYKMTLLGRIYTPTPESTFNKVCLILSIENLVCNFSKISTPYCL